MNITEVLKECDTRHLNIVSIGMSDALIKIVKFAYTEGVKLATEVALRKIKEIGITKDTPIIEISGGMLTEVHNAPNGYVLFDWDVIREDDDVERQQTNLVKLLEEREA
jgi:hypothetical protein|tara:strand:- start:5432 stop:5758 length:327 start_codon:yes stop_codon:yes gene_type:complete